MISRFTDAQAAQRVRAVSVPGGIARQYRVQYQPADSKVWQVAGSYREREEAEKAVEALRAQGLQARLVEYRFCPAAA
jgi:uncharacterized protein YegP (UPF0339 family)